VLCISRRLLSVLVGWLTRWTSDGTGYLLPSCQLYLPLYSSSWTSRSLLSLSTARKTNCLLVSQCRFAAVATAATTVATDAAAVATAVAAAVATTDAAAVAAAVVAATAAVAVAVATTVAAVATAAAVVAATTAAAAVAAAVVVVVIVNLYSAFM